ncbi:MAG: adenylate kinase [Chitinophagaceae bacterium]|nr:adenylate kinase [Chitinophagaceae bacterium]
MLNIILFGPPGSGKGTQAMKLKEKYNLAHISTGDIFRAVIATPSDLGNELRSYMDQGQLVPDELTFRVLASYIDGHDLLKSGGIIFDGFPRTIPQANALDRFFAERNSNITIVLSLLVQEEEVVQRLLLRGQTSGRIDDNNEVVIRKRMQVYRDQTLPLAAYYSDQHKFIELKGQGTVDEVFELLCREIDHLLPPTV